MHMPHRLKFGKTNAPLLLIFIMIGFLGLIVIAGSSEGKVITVDDSGGKDYTTIQEAIDNAEANDTIEVYNGTYTENLKIYKPVKIVSKYGSKETFIAAKDDTDHAVEVMANYVTVQGFNVSGAYGDFFGSAAFYMDGCENCVIEENEIFDNAYGIQMTDSSFNRFINNTFVKNMDWCVFNAQNGCDFNVVSGNLFEYNADNAIYFGSSSDNIIQDNLIRYAGQDGFERVGIFLDHRSNSNYLIDNQVSHHRIGILLNDGCDYNQIVGNYLFDNDDWGLGLDNMFPDFGETGNDDNLLDSNSFYNNDAHDFYSKDSKDNEIKKQKHLGDWAITFSLKYEDDEMGLDPTESPPASDPDEWQNVGKYVDYTSYQEGSFLAIDLHYEDTDLGDVDESSLTLWFFNGASWEEIPASTVDTENNKVSGNMTPKNGTAAIMGKGPMGPPIWNSDTDEEFQSLQGAIDDEDTADGHTIRIGTGKLDENVVITKGLIIAGDGKDNTTVEGKNDNPVFKIQSEDVVLMDLKIEGGSHGIDIRADNSHILSLSIGSSSGNGIQISESDYALIENCFTNENSGSGVNILKSSLVDILGTGSESNGNHGFEISESDYALIENCFTNENSGSGVNILKSSLVDIRATVSEKNGKNGMDVDDSEGISVRSSSFKENKLSGLKINKVIDIEAYDCDISDNELDGLEARLAEQAKILDSIVARNERNGLILELSERVQVEDTVIRENGNHGIDLSEVAKSVFQKCEILSSIKDAIHAQNLQDVRLELVKLLNNGGNGLNLTQSENVTTKNCTAENNTKNGVSLEDDNICPIIDLKTANNGENGVKVNNSKTVNITNSKAENNTGDGFWSYLTEALKMANVEASGNKGNGLTIIEPKMQMAGVTSDIDIKSWNNAGDGVFIDRARGFQGDMIITLMSDLRGNGGHAIVIKGSGNLRVWNSKLTSNGMNGLLLKDSNDIAIEELQIEDNEGFGVEVENSNNVKIESTQISKCGGPGIGMKDSDLININQCFADRNNGDGINASKSSNVTVTNSTARNNSKNGATFIQSQDITIRSSEFSFSGYSGMKFDYSSKGLVADTKSMGNLDYGIRMRHLSYYDIGFVWLKNNQMGEMRVERSNHLTLDDVTSTQSSRIGFGFYNSQNIVFTNSWLGMVFVPDLIGPRHFIETEYSFTKFSSLRLDLGPVLRTYPEKEYGVQYHRHHALEILYRGSSPTNSSTSMENITIVHLNMTFSYGTTSGMELGPSPEIPSNPSSMGNISKSLNATNLTENAWLDIKFHYNLSDLGNVIESTLKLYHYVEGTGWQVVPGSGVNVDENYVYGNVTEFSIIAPLGEVAVNVVPSISILSPPDDSEVSGTIAVTGSATDENGDHNIQKVEIKVNNGTWQVATGTVDWSFPMDTTTLQNGDITILARAFDLESSSTIAEIHLDVQNVEVQNAIPMITLSSPKDGAEIWETITIAGNATDQDGTVVRVEISIDDGEWITVEGIDSWNFSWDSTSVDDGDHTIRVRAFDGEDYSEIITLDLKVYNEDEEDSGGFLPFSGWTIFLFSLMVSWALVALKRKLKDIC